LLFRLPCRTDHPAYFGLASFISPILSAVDGSKTKQSLHRCQRNYRCNHEISVNRTVENMPLLIPAQRCCYLAVRNSGENDSAYSSATTRRHGPPGRQPAGIVL
jgi:hypothetical protein